MSSAVDSQDFNSDVEVDSKAMEATSVLSLYELSQQEWQVKAVAILEATGEALFAPTTAEGLKCNFELSPDEFHELSGDHDYMLRDSHHGIQGLPLHIVVGAEDAEILDAVDENVKKLYRMVTRAKGAWNHLVKTSTSGKRVFAAELILEGGEHPTEIIIMKPGHEDVIGHGADFLITQIGNFQNLEEYLCNAILELSWILGTCDSGFRLRLKAHSVVLKKKFKSVPPTTSLGKRQALRDNNRLTKIKKVY